MSEPAHLHVELKIAPAHLGAFLETMNDVAPLMERDDWSLAGAWRIRVGRAHTIVVIWRTADANAFFSGRFALRSHPRFAAFRQVIDAAVIEETVSMMTPVAYGRSQ